MRTTMICMSALAVLYNRLSISLNPNGTTHWPETALVGKFPHPAKACVCQERTTKSKYTYTACYFFFHTLPTPLSLNKLAT